MGNVYVYEGLSSDFSTIGLVGALSPSECAHEEVGNGASELTLVHPVDSWGRYAALLPDRILCAPVPVRTCPEITNGTIVTSFEIWTVKANASKAQRYVYSKRSGGSKKKLLKAGVRVLVTLKDESAGRYKIRYGGTVTTNSVTQMQQMSGGTSGWISKDALQFVVSETAPATPAGIEKVEPAWRVRDQLFRIVDVKKSEAGDAVTVTALRIFYDLLGNLTNYKTTGQVTAQAALAQISTQCVVATDFEFYSDIVGTRTGVDWTRTNPVRALLDDASGFCALWGAQLVRDDWDVYCLSSAGLDRGVRIEYAKNLTGVDCSENIEGVITRIIPVGETKTGSELLLDGAIWVDSPLIANYATPRIHYLKCDGAKVSGGVSTALARARMREQAQAMITKGCDKPAMSVTVDFVNLGDTAEYAQYRSLDSVFLFDTVTVFHPRLGINVKADVVRVVWDVLAGRMRTIELGSVTGSLATSLTAQSMVEVALAAARKEETALRVSVESSAGSVLFWNAGATTTLNARVLADGEDGTDEIDASRFMWTRDTGNATADAAWAAAHVGVKTVTVQASELGAALKARYTCKILEVTA